MNDSIMEHVRRWYNALPERERPDWVDVETVMRLGVVSSEVVSRLILRNAESLARNFDELASVIRSHSAVPAAGSSRTSAAEDVSLGSRDSGVLSKKERLQAWLVDLEVDLAPEVIEQISSATSLAQLRGLVPRELLRKRAPELAGILGFADDAGASSNGGRSSSRGDGPFADGSPAMPVIDAGGFSAFNNWQSQTDLTVRFSATSGEGIGFGWDPPLDDRGVCIYRVTARDDYEPISPDDSRSIATTAETEAVDTEPFTSAKRHIAVWLHSGVDEPSARAAQAELWATGTLVLPVREVKITETDGQVYGTWTVSEGVERVEVARVPNIEAHVAYSPDQVVSGQNPGENLRGFEDKPGPGRWVYRITVCASHDGRSLRSARVDESVKVQAVLPRILDLEIREDPHAPDVYTVSWTKPSRADVKIEVHRHSEPLPAGADAKVLDHEAMARLELTEDSRINQPAIERDGRMVIERVRWPAGAPRIHFTAVARGADEDQFQIGNSVTRNRAGPVTHTLLVERTDEQFLTFAWPEGADFVEVYQGATGVRVDEITSLTRILELSHDKYLRLGGAHLRNPLPAGGCSLHLVGVSREAGKPTRGPVCSLEYPGLTRITYRIDRATPEEPVKRGFLRRKQSVGGERQPGRLIVDSDRDVESVVLVLVHHPDRLPLHSGDGEKVLGGPVALRAGQPLTLKEQMTELLGRNGFVRLFVEVPEHELERYAVLDPAVDQLRCD